MGIGRFYMDTKKKNVGGVSRVHLGYRRRDVEAWLQKTKVDKFAMGSRTD